MVAVIPQLETAPGVSQGRVVPVLLFCSSLDNTFQDITNKVHGHRSLEDLRIEIEKIQTDL